MQTDVRHVLLDSLNEACQHRFLPPVDVVSHPDDPTTAWVRFASGIVLRVDITAVEVLHG